MMTKFVDTNFFLRFLTNDVPHQAKRAERVLKDADGGRLELFCSDLVIAEIAWTLESFYQEPREKIAQSLGRILAIKNLEVPSKENWLEALEIFVKENIELIDAFNYTVMRDKGIKKIYSFDKHFDRFADVARENL